MNRAFEIRSIRAAVMCSLLVFALMGNVALAAPQMHTSKPFAGPKANKGTVTHSIKNGKSTLTLSDDFVVPDTPDPHWMLVDSTGKTYLVQKLKIKNDGFNKSIEVPSYVKDVAKVIIWCAWAEANLGEASFDKPVK
jgi:hypothetical protein